MTTSTLTRRLTTVVLATFLTAAPVLAQDAAPADADNAGGGAGLNMGTPADATSDGPQQGQRYVKDVSGDWEIACVKSTFEADACMLQQLMRDEEGNAVSNIEVFNVPNGGEAVAGANIHTPLETLLTGQVTLTVDGGQSLKYPFTYCTARSCVASIGFSQPTLDSFKRGNKATLSIVPLGAPDQRVTVALSLAGFTAGLEAITKNNAEFAAAVEKARAAEGAGTGAN